MTLYSRTDLKLRYSLIFRHLHVTYWTFGNIVYVLPFTSKSIFWTILRHMVNCTPLAWSEQSFLSKSGKGSWLHRLSLWLLHSKHLIAKPVENRKKVWTFFMTLLNILGRRLRKMSARVQTARCVRNYKYVCYRDPCIHHRCFYGEYLPNFVMGSYLTSLYCTLKSPRNYVVYIPQLVVTVCHEWI